jgi:hypothetical protein
MSVGAESEKLGCDQCKEQQYQDESSQTTCKHCGKGSSNKGTGNTGCVRTPPGSFVNTTNGTEDCTKGIYCNGGSSGRIPCNKGTYASDTGSVKCFPCAPGTFAASPQTIECEECPKGWLQKEKGQDNCRKPDNGTISAGGAASVEISEGWHSTNCSNGVCQESKPCPEGTKGSDDRKSCIPCEAGTTSFKGSTSCIPCSKGKFASLKETAKCMDCPAGFFQSKDDEPSVGCEKCPSGWDFVLDESNKPVNGSAACRDLVSVFCFFC